MSFLFSGPFLMTIANEITKVSGLDFTCSTGWLTRGSKRDTASHAAQKSTFCFGFIVKGKIVTMFVLVNVNRCFVKGKACQ